MPATAVNMTINTISVGMIATIKLFIIDLIERKESNVKIIYAMNEDEKNTTLTPLAF